ncbi:hypothetical protein HD598_002111 [Neomicrococcus aestuarii]|uniref:Uncharacterized protein n=1 Tax=Neomicrococcus aestuarii TaxID=556325 RepID=A0A7W8X220_9MICC|nr:hypothetical protein [Neomicrococcus aestuarii]
MSPMEVLSTTPNEESATSLEVTLSKLTATDVAAISLATGVCPSELFNSISQHFARI